MPEWLRRTPVPTVRRNAAAGQFLAQLPVDAAAPALPPKRADGALTEILPPFGTNPPQRPLVAASSDLSDRLIHGDPRELWYLALPDKLLPKQCVQILRSALGGDLWQQWQLMSLMLDTWPMLRKCAHQIRSACAAVTYKCHPYTESGDKPTKTAQAKADLVKRAMSSFRPDPMQEEEGWYGTVYDLTDAVLNGMSMGEILWQDVVTPKHGRETLPRATAWVHPRHFTFGTDGRLALFDEMYHRYTFALSDKAGKLPDANKFLCAKAKTRSGSSLGAGMIRPLAWDWSAVVFARDWMLRHAQKWGNPFLDVKYEPGMTTDEHAALDAFLAQAGNQGYLKHISKASVEVNPPVNLGPTDPQEVLMRKADEHCMLLLLGETTSTHGKSGGGLNSNDQEPGKVRREVVEGWARWVGEILTLQFATAVLRVNYGEDSECPTIESDFTEATDPLAQAQTDQAFLASGVPIPADDFYRRNCMETPQPGDMVLVGGKLGVLGDTSQEIDPNPTQPAALQPVAGKDDGENNFSKSVGLDNSRSAASGGLRGAMAAATDAELVELERLAVTAAEASHPNGELAALGVKINHIRARARGNSRRV